MHRPLKEMAPKNIMENAMDSNVNKMGSKHGEKASEKRQHNLKAEGENAVPAGMETVTVESSM